MSKSSGKREKKLRRLEREREELSRRRLISGLKCAALVMGFLALFTVAQLLVANGVVGDSQMILVYAILLGGGCIFVRFAWGFFCECKDCHVQ